LHCSSLSPCAAPRKRRVRLTDLAQEALVSLPSEAITRCIIDGAPTSPALLNSVTTSMLSSSATTKLPAPSPGPNPRPSKAAQAGFRGLVIRVIRKVGELGGRPDAWGAAHSTGERCVPKMASA